MLRSDAAALATPRAAFVGEQYVINGLAWMGADDRRGRWAGGVAAVAGGAGPPRPQAAGAGGGAVPGGGNGAQVAAVVPLELGDGVVGGVRWTVWWPRGSLRHPGCRREVATVWQVAGINVP